LEEALVEKAAPKRRREFALGRACARGALEKLGHGGAVIGRGANGAPLWPQGFIGSITHTSGYAAAVVGETLNFSGIGVDAERVGGVTQDLWPRLFDEVERDHLMGLDEPDRGGIATLFFSAKEACYKAWGGAGALAFRDIRVTPGAHRFTAARSGEILHGRYAVDGDLMLTAVWF
jgi:4'-phosphopantetheinyl transferase EntD